MKPKIPPPQLKKCNAAGLADLMIDPRFDQLIGRSAVVKIELLVNAINGASTAESIARRFGLSRQAMTRHLRRLGEVYGPLVNGKLTDLV